MRVGEMSFSFQKSICSAILVTVLERNGTVDSIFSGYKYLHRHTAERERRP